MRVLAWIIKLFMSKSRGRGCPAWAIMRFIPPQPTPPDLSQAIEDRTNAVVFNDEQVWRRHTTDTLERRSSLWRRERRVATRKGWTAESPRSVIDEKVWLLQDGAMRTWIHETREGQRFVNRDFWVKRDGVWKQCVSDEVGVWATARYPRDESR